MITVKLFDRHGECIRWFTGAATEVDRYRDLWRLIFPGMTVVVEGAAR